MDWDKVRKEEQIKRAKKNIKDFQSTSAQPRPPRAVVRAWSNKALEEFEKDEKKKKKSMFKAPKNEMGTDGNFYKKGRQVPLHLRSS